MYACLCAVNGQIELNVSRRFNACMSCRQETNDKYACCSPHKQLITDTPSRLFFFVPAFWFARFKTFHANTKMIITACQSSTRQFRSTLCFVQTQSCERVDSPRRHSTPIQRFKILFDSHGSSRGRSDHGFTFYRPI